jgi:hypothetical protein
MVGGISWYFSEGYPYFRNLWWCIRELCCDVVHIPEIIFSYREIVYIQWNVCWAFVCLTVRRSCSCDFNEYWWAYHEKIVFIWIMWILKGLFREMFMWLQCVMTSLIMSSPYSCALCELWWVLPRRSPYSCELCELSWVLPREVHIDVNSMSYGESYREKSIFMWTLWAKVNVTERSTYWCELCELWWVLPREVHIDVNSMSYGESYREKSIFMWTLWAMVSLTERSPCSCELCELWWLLPREVHIHVNSVSYGESYREKSIFMWTLRVMVNLTERSPYSCELCELWWVLPR